MRYFLSLLFLIGCECTCHAQEPLTPQEVGGVYKLETDQGLASCVGLETPGHDHIHFLTINHAVEGTNLRVSVHGKEIPCSIASRWESHPEPLVLIRSLTKFVGTTFKAYPLAVEGVATTGQVYVVGFPSGKYTGKKTTVVDIQPLHGSYYVTDGISWHGTSGGAMLNEDGELVGIVSSISRKNKTTTCVNVLAATKMFKNTEKVQWRCTPRGCYMTCPPVNGYRVIERGSAGILGQRYERSVESSIPSPVVQQDVPYELPSTVEQGPTGPRGEQDPHGEQGPAGKDGLPGRDGKDGKVDQASIETAIVTWLESNKEDLKGQTGLTGPAGRSVEKEDIQAAVNKWLAENFKQPTGSGEPVDLSDIESRLAAIEARKIRIVTSKGKVLVDDETYSGSQDDPIILNIDRILHAATTASK